MIAFLGNVRRMRTEMTETLPVFDAVKPIGKCGACGDMLYPHSTPNLCDYRRDCPIYGDNWMAYQAARRMRRLETPQRE